MTPQKRNGYIFLAILVSAIGLRFLNLTKFDLQNDPAAYAFRSFGWLDYLSGVGQTSPLVWFKTLPWWAQLSFHDAPPLTFVIQHISFLIFGNNIIAALLPYILANLVIIYLLYLLLKKIGQEKMGLIAAGIFAISSYTIWMSRTGYLEGMETLFITLSIYAFLIFLQNQKTRYLYFWGLAVGLALLSKYTAIFIIPTTFFYLLIWQRPTLKNKHFWLSCLLIAIILTPVIIYNIMVFKARGHFDAALSSMLGMKPADFSTLSGRGLNANLFTNLVDVLRSLMDSISLPLSILYLSALVHSFWRAIKKQSTPLNNFLRVNIVLILLMFTFSGGTARFLLIITPFLAILSSQAILYWWECFAVTKNKQKIFIAILTLVAAFELFFSLNTNILAKPLINNNLFYSPDRFYNNGFNDLDKFLRQDVLGKLPAKRKISNLKDVQEFYLESQDVVLVDERLDWFSRLWYINKYIFYYHSPLFYFNDVLTATASSNLSMVQYLRDVGAQGIWFVFSTDQGAVANQADKGYAAKMANYQKQLESTGLKPKYEIKNYADQVVMKIYYLPDNN
ncbi:MAG: glycosyltransferase family 39 protein [Patescibacteria group bacterium]